MRSSAKTQTTPLFAIFVSTHETIQGLLLAEAGPAGCVCVIGALGFGLVFAVHKLLSGGGGGSGLSIGNGPASGGNGTEGSPATSKSLSYDGKLLSPCNMVRGRWGADAIYWGAELVWCAGHLTFPWAPLKLPFTWK